MTTLEDTKPKADSGQPMTVRVRRVEGAPVLSARVWLRGGARVEDVPGLALVTGRLLVEGTERRAFDRIALDAEDRGILLHSFGTYESLGVAVDCLSEDTDLALDWLAEMLFDATFSEDRLSWIQRQTAAELDSIFDAPESMTAKVFAEQLYHPHAYGRPLQGSRSSLMTLQSDQCAAFHQQALGWGGCLVVAGDLDEDAVRKRLETLFSFPSLCKRGVRGDFPAVPLQEKEAGCQPLPQVAPPVGLDTDRNVVELPPGEQAHLYAGHLTVPRTHSDVPALEVAAVILGAGSGLVGRLPERIREREGLAYQVGIQLTAGAGIDPGRLTAYVGTAPATHGAAENAVRQELQRLVEHGITDQEFDDARSFLLGRDPFRRQTARQWADLLTEAEFYGLPTHRPEWVAEVLGALTRDEVEAAVRRHVRPEDLKVTVGLPGE